MPLPLLGFRFWRLREGKLWSWVTPDFCWNLGGITYGTHAVDMSAVRDPEVVRLHHICPGDSPDECGLYGFKTLATAQGGIDKYGPRTSRRESGDPTVRPVCGAVIGAGAVCRHEEGWRAAQAKIVALGYETTYELTLLKQIAGPFGIPVLHVSQIEAYAGEWGERL